MEENITDSLKYFAKTILKHGETKKDTFICLLPDFYKFIIFRNDEEISEDDHEFIKNSTILYNEVRATHYTCEWENVEKHLVRIKIYAMGAFGAVLNNCHPVIDEVICIVA